jgi:uncharacterized membrane protein YbhN (UPF0104 family)
MNSKLAPSPSSHKGVGRGVLRLTVSAVLLAGLAWLLDARAIAARLADLSPRWALIALAISIPQYVLLALRWCLTASRLGVRLPFRTALLEYYLGTFINQILPGGVMGDVSRAWRHARAHATEREPGAPTPRLSPAVSAVILERASGQVVMLAVAALSVFYLPSSFELPALATLAALGVGIALLAGLVWLGRGRLAQAGRDVHRALLARDVVVPQLVTSALVTATYVAMYVAAARAVGARTPLAALVPLVPPVLVSMLVPATVAGWGIREVTAAALWSAVGMTAEDGVAISAAYGVLVLLSTLPGALVLLSAGRGRRARPLPDGSDGSAGGSPDRAPGSPAG